MRESWIRGWASGTPPGRETPRAGGSWAFPQGLVAAELLHLLGETRDHPCGKLQHRDHQQRRPHGPSGVALRPAA